MTTAEKVFTVIMAVNTLIAIAYYIWGCIIQTAEGEKKPFKEQKKTPEKMREDRKKALGKANKRQEKASEEQQESPKRVSGQAQADPESEENQEQEVSTPEQRLSRTGYLFKALVILLCPVVGILFFLVTQLMYVLFFRTKADLTDVIFGKDKVVANRKADEDSERNRVPIEEALAVADKESLRSLVMDVVKGDVYKSLATISLALNSEDTETSHYAASVLRDTLNDFRQKSQELYNALHKGDENAADIACTLMEYMNEVLCQEVFPDMEQKAFVEMMEEAGDWLYKSEENRYRLTCEYIEWIALRLLGTKQYDKMKTWCGRCMEMYPEELPSYTIQLKLYFSIQDKENFFGTMNRLKESDIVIDRNTLDLIRVFN